MNRMKKISAILMTAVLLTAMFAAIPTATAATATYPAALTRTLYQGSTGEDVRIVQTILKGLGYYTGAVDGDYGRNTTAAVVAYQKKNGLTADGVVGPTTYRKLISGTSVSANTSSGSSQITTSSRNLLKYGDTGSDVLALQNQLQYLGYYSGPLSGNYLSQTREAVRLFQKAHGITVDGVAGRVTLGLVFSNNAKPYSPSKPATPKPTAKPPQQAQRTLRYGMQGDDVALMQTRLAQLGYYGGSVNGKFDKATLNAVLTFQANNWMYADGVVGPETWARIFANGAVPFYPPVQQPYPTYQPPIIGNTPGKPTVNVSKDNFAAALYWPAVSGAASYLVQITASPSGAGTMVEISATQISLSGTLLDRYVAGDLIQWSVISVSSSGKQSGAATGSFQKAAPAATPAPTATPAPAPMAVPNTPSGVSISADGRQISWAAVPNATSYYIEITWGTQYLDHLTEQTSIQLPSTWTPSGETLTYRIDARNSAGSSPANIGSYTY